MKRILLACAVVIAALATGAATTTNPANAPNGTHFKRGTATCSVNSNTGSVTCSGFTLAGVGNTNATAQLTATYTATVVCVNGGGNPSDSQHQGSFSQSTGPIQFQSKNGNLTVTGTTVSAPSQQQFLSQQTCPNPNWTPTLGSGITLSSFTYTLTFAGFSSPYVTITGP